MCAVGRSSGGCAMIVNTLLDLVVNSICGIFHGLEVLSLPIDLIGALVTVLEYGNAIVGTDLMLIIFGSIMGWLAIRTTAGLVIFIWRLLPLT